MGVIFRYTLAAVKAAARERRELALENIALRHQIEVLTRNRRRPQLQPADRLLWSSLSCMWPSWRRRLCQDSDHESSTVTLTDDAGEDCS